MKLSIWQLIDFQVGALHLYHSCF